MQFLIRVVFDRRAPFEIAKRVIRAIAITVRAMPFWVWAWADKFRKNKAMHKSANLSVKADKRDGSVLLMISGSPRLYNEPSFRIPSTPHNPHNYARVADGIIRRFCNDFPVHLASPYEPKHVSSAS